MEGFADTQFLTFLLDGETYAVPVGKVREVLEYTKPTKLPKTLPYMKGVINVRGTGVPVIDLREKFDMLELQVTKDTAIIIMEISDAEGQQQLIGALTDQVNEVMEIDSDQLEPPPRFGSKVETSFIHSVGKRENSFIIVLDLDKAFSHQEFNVITGIPDPTTA